MRLITNLNSTQEEFDKRLRYVTEPVPKVTDKLRNVAIELLGAMYSLNALGLAANQVGLKIRLCVMDPAWMQGSKLPIVMFNPEFVECGEERYESPEGCLSLPDLGARVPRFRNVKIKFLGLDGKERTIADDNSLLASVMQHEMDHLNGNLLVDRLIEPMEVSYKGSIVKGV
jgi:peptide deformylase